LCEGCAARQAYECARRAHDARRAVAGPATTTIIDVTWHCAVRSGHLSRATVAFILVLVGAVAGCADHDATAGLSDNGGQVHIDAGDVFDIVLPSDYARCNCQWHDKETNDWDILRPLGSRYEPQRALPGHPDAGTFTARLKAVESGTTTVTLVQEDNANPPHVASRYTLDVTVD